MKAIYFKLVKTALLGAALFTTPLVNAIEIEIALDYSNTVGSAIYFDGKSNFTFTPPVNNFKVTAGDSATGLLGEMTGTYTIGTVTTIGKLSSAPVTGSGLFRIHDGFGYDLVGNLTWIDILQYGTGSVLNTSGSVSVTNFTYSGLNPTLLLLASDGADAANVLSFQFVPARSLSKLKTTKGTTSFSGSIYTRRIPEGGNTVLLLGAVLAVAALVNRRLRLI